MATLPEYAELHALSNFTFLRGASRPEELVERAQALGYGALALTDECSVAGVVRAHTQAQGLALKFIVGSEFRLTDGSRCVLLATNRQGYAQLCQLITLGRRAAVKGSYQLARSDFERPLQDCLLLWLPGNELTLAEAQWWRERFAGRAWLAVELLTTGMDRERLALLQTLARAADLPCVASGDIHMHARERRMLQDTLTAIRLRTPVASAGHALYPNGERHLRTRRRLASLYPAELLAATLDIAARCHFSLTELRYEYPAEVVPAGETASSWLRQLALTGLAWRWPAGAPEKIRALLEEELALIAELAYESYFLTVHDLVAFANKEGILCQGRGSAANSLVCYCLGITAVHPDRMHMLFGRFISRERQEPPDIDVDFEHERREEVIQYIYRKYGRQRAALTATLITYHARSAIRDVGKALGLDVLQVDRLARAMQWWDGGELEPARIREAGFDPHNPLIARLTSLVQQLLGFPRHLSQHVGGFVIARGLVEELVPIENASMPDRTVIQWDKDDLDQLGLLKVDVLGLGMLTALRRSFEFVREFRGRQLTLASMPEDDPAVYAMISSADTVGVFQIESRAQMSMLPRLQPACYYDLVIEVAIVRPGPIQGGMVHPYLQRREERRAGKSDADYYPNDAVRGVLGRTLGIPIFQEQVMHLAIVAAGFSAGEADRLRRAMAAWKRRGGLGPFEQQLIDGMRERGYTEEFARRIFRQIQGFGEYGFPESHAASFALLVYVSAWLKHYEPAAFTAALLNSLPMGFYAPAQLVSDARQHDVEVREPDVRRSDWHCTLERRTDGEPALRLGLKLVQGFGEAAAARVVAAREQAAFTSVQQLTERAHLGRRELAALAAAGALAGLAGHRHLAAWEAAGVESALPLFPEFRINEATPLLRAPTEGEDIVADYRSLGLTLGRHPLALLRSRLAGEGLLSAAELRQLEDGALARTAGLVLVKQRPGTAKGVMFVTLEDETGIVNLIVWQQVAERWRRTWLNSQLLEVSGQWQRQGEVMHLVARGFRNRSRLIGQLLVQSRDFH